MDDHYIRFTGPAAAESALPLVEFLRLGGQFNGRIDARVLYDDLADRFLVVALLSDQLAEASRGHTAAFAVSADKDELEKWWLVTLNLWAKNDGQSLQPRLADLEVDQTDLAIAFDLRDQRGAEVRQRQVWVVEKGQGARGFYDGGTARVSVLAN